VGRERRPVLGTEHVFPVNLYRKHVTNLHFDNVVSVNPEQETRGILQKRDYGESRPKIRLKSALQKCGSDGPIDQKYDTNVYYEYYEHILAMYLGLDIRHKSLIKKWSQ